MNGIIALKISPDDVSHEIDRFYTAKIIPLSI
jgi:hypothetical protein